jgi:hypothetical protein
MIVADITELALMGVYDRGIPNQERIVLLARQQLNVGQYGIMLGIRMSSALPSKMAQPVRDNLFWFGDGILNAGDWIFLYTGPGQARAGIVPNTIQRMYTMHWGRKETILHHPDLVPILFRMDAVIVG